MVQLHTLLILFVISFAFISIAYAEAQDEFAVKSRHAHSGSDIGSDSGNHGFLRHTRTMTSQNQAMVVDSVVDSLVDMDTVVDTVCGTVVLDTVVLDTVVFTSVGGRYSGGYSHRYGGY